MERIPNPVTEWHSTSQQSPVVASPWRGVVLHHGATTSADDIIHMEVSGSRQVSSHRVVKDNRNAKVVDDWMRAWSLSSSYYDSVFHSIECANESTDGWTISYASHVTMAKQVAFWAQNEGWWPHRSGDPKTWTVIGHREVYTIYGASYDTVCPGGMNLDLVVELAQKYLRNGDSDLSAAEVETILSAIRRDNRGRIFYDAGADGKLPFDQGKRFAIGQIGRVQAMSSDPAQAKAQIEQYRASGSGLIFALTESPQPCRTIDFNSTLDWFRDPFSPYGHFVKNTFELEGGSTRMVRTDRSDDYPNRTDVWRDGRPVEITKGGKVVSGFVRRGSKSYAVIDGEEILLTQTEVDRANAQVANGQIWVVV